MNRNLPISIATILEKAQQVKDNIARIDKEAGPDDALFRQMIKAYFRPDLKADYQIVRRH